jgi:hypothetical protein
MTGTYTTPEAIKAEAGVEPIKGTWLALGQPQTFIYLGGKPNPLAQGWEVTKVERVKNTLTLIGQDEGGTDMTATHGVTGKFWAVVGTPAPAAEGTQLDPTPAPATVEAVGEAKAERLAKQAAAKVEREQAQAARADKLTQAAAARLAKLDPTKLERLQGYMQDHPGYAIIWPKGSWSTLKLVAPDLAPEDSPTWLILCNDHGTTKALDSSKAAEAEGTKAQLATWCKPHKQAAAKAERDAAKLAAKDQATQDQAPAE